MSQLGLMSSREINYALGLAMASDIEAVQQIEIAAGRQFSEVGLEAIASDPPPQTQILQAHIKNRTLWVARSGELILGYASASIVDGEAHLDQISVDPTHQGSGVGSALIEMICDWARQEIFPAVTLTTFVGVPWNGPFYERRGFKRLDLDEMGPELQAIRQREIEDGLDISPRWAMRKVLDG
jgi:GNAT superfamily N-acetyltransferase